MMLLCTGNIVLVRDFSTSNDVGFCGMNDGCHMWCISLGVACMMGNDEVHRSFSLHVTSIKPVLYSSRFYVRYFLRLVSFVCVCNDVK